MLPSPSAASSSSLLPGSAIHEALTPRAGRAEPEPGGIVIPPTFFEPSFNLRGVLKRLRDETLKDSDRRRDILGVHIKFWHAPASEMVRMLGLGKVDMVLRKLIAETIPCLCRDCMSVARTMTNTLIKVKLATRFNHRVQTDLFSSST